MVSKRMSIFQKIYCLVSVAVLIIFAYFMLLQYIPDRMMVEDVHQTISLEVPVSLEEMKDIEAVSATASSNGNKGYCTYLCKLFGMIPVKQIEVMASGEQMVYAVGKPIGIYMKMNAVLVAGVKELEGGSGNNSDILHAVYPGDYITAINGEAIETKEALTNAVRETQGNEMILSIHRNNENIQVVVKPILMGNSEYKLGLWVKDDLSGVGTMTYYTKEGQYGALGHEVSNSDTGMMLDMKQGYIYPSNIAQVDKGVAGQPGEITGMIRYGSQSMLGKVNSNTKTGIYGELSANAKQLLQGTKYEVAYKQDIKKDKAVILFALENQVEAYQIQIETVDYNSKEVNKSFRFRITDEKLLKETGGIVQGMSGSPIIQEGKLIGAVTHVFVSDPKEGYGIFAETMLEQQ